MIYRKAYLDGVQHGFEGGGVLVGVCLLVDSLVRESRKGGFVIISKNTSSHA